MSEDASNAHNANIALVWDDGCKMFGLKGLRLLNIITRWLS